MPDTKKKIQAHPPGMSECLSKVTQIMEGPDRELFKAMVDVFAERSFFARLSPDKIESLKAYRKLLAIDDDCTKIITTVIMALAKKLKIQAHPPGMSECLSKVTQIMEGPDRKLFKALVDVFAERKEAITNFPELFLTKCCTSTPMS